MTITNDDVRDLMLAGKDAVLVLIEGRTEIIGREQLDDDRRGALEVISRADLLARTNRTDMSDEEVADQAAALDAAVSELGG